MTNIENTSSVNMLTSRRDTSRRDDSHLYGTEPLNDIKSLSLKSPAPLHESTVPHESSMDFNRYQTPSTKHVLSSSVQTPIESMTPRKIQKRTKQRNQNEKKKNVSA